MLFKEVARVTILRYKTNLKCVSSVCPVKPLLMVLCGHIPHTCVTHTHTHTYTRLFNTYIYLNFGCSKPSGEELQRAVFSEFKTLFSHFQGKSCIASFPVWGAENTEEFIFSSFVTSFRKHFLSICHLLSTGNGNSAMNRFCRAPVSIELSFFQWREINTIMVNGS